MCGAWDRLHFLEDGFLKDAHKELFDITHAITKTRASVKGEVLALETSYFPTVMGDWPNFLHTRNALSQLEHKTIKISFLRKKKEKKHLQTYTNRAHIPFLQSFWFAVLPTFAARQIKIYWTRVGSAFNYVSAGQWFIFLCSRYRAKWAFLIQLHNSILWYINFNITTANLCDEYDKVRSMKGNWDFFRSSLPTACENSKEKSFYRLN